MVGLSIFGTNVNPSFLISSCSVAYVSGFAAANFEWLAWWLMMLLAMLFVPYYLKTRVSTMPGFIRRRFGAGPHAFLAYYALFTTIVSWLGLVLYTGGLLFSQIMDWPLWLSLVALMAVAASFTVMGGLAAVMVTDAFQTVLMIAGAAALSIIGLVEVGGVSRLLERVPDSYWWLLRADEKAEYPWPAMLLGYPVAGIWFWCADQTIVQRVLGARDLRHGQLGVVFAAFLKVLTPFLFLLPGILCFVLHPGLEDPKQAFATMVVNHLPTGMVGLIVAVLIAALISTIDSGLNSFSTVFTLDIYTRRIRPAASPSEIKLVGRLATVAAAVIAVLSALAMDRFDRSLFDMIQSVIGFIAPPVSAVFLVGVLWPRATSRAALATLIAGSIASISIGLLNLNDWPSKAFWPHFLLLSFYTFAGICLFMVVASLLTRNDPRQEELPPITVAQRAEGSGPRVVWALWGLLAKVRRRQLDPSRHLHVHVDTDGRVEPVIPLYREAIGMDVMSPFEVASGCDVVRLGRDHPDLALFGGIDRRELARGPEAIDRMVERILPPMRERGGYIPHCDHAVPEEVSLHDYLHYRKRCRELAG